jgi:aminoglycoside/choline kinase family phosphotransferase
LSPIRRELQRYLGEAFPGARIVPMTGDASTRSFYRLEASSGPARVVMDYGTPFAGETDDMRVTRLFEAARLPVARILEAAGDPGCLVLEDLGQRTLEQALSSAAPQERRRLYGAAVDLAAAIANRGTVELERQGGTWPALDADRFRFEMDFFVEHYACGLKGMALVPSEVVSLLHALAERAAETPRRVLCHRDYHSRNLVVRDGGLAMVDIQDARWGPDSYDLASLLKDAYVDIADGEAEELLERYLDGLSVRPERGDFRERFDLVAAQRMIKALGTFGYQVARLRRDRYLDAVPRTLARLRKELRRRPETAALGSALEKAGLLEGV